jgi:hypothetical protein
MKEELFLVSSNTFTLMNNAMAGIARLASIRAMGTM